LEKKIRRDILTTWIILLIGFGNLILVFGTHLLDSWLDVSGYQKGFTFFGFKIPKNLLIDSLYSLIFILQVILMYLIFENRIKKIINDITKRG